MMIMSAKTGRRTQNSANQYTRAISYFEKWMERKRGRESFAVEESPLLKIDFRERLPTPSWLFGEKHLQSDRPPVAEPSPSSPAATSAVVVSPACGGAS